MELLPSARIYIGFVYLDSVAPIQHCRDMTPQWKCKIWVGLHSVHDIPVKGSHSNNTVPETVGSWNHWDKDKLKWTWHCRWHHWDMAYVLLFCLVPPYHPMGRVPTNRQAFVLTYFDLPQFLSTLFSRDKIILLFCIFPRLFNLTPQISWIVLRQ